MYVYQVVSNTGICNDISKNTLHSTPKKAINWLENVILEKDGLTLADFRKTRKDVELGLTLDRYVLFFRGNSLNYTYSIIKKRIH